MAEVRIPRVINAAGHLSMLGGGVTPPALARRIARAIEEALQQPVEMRRLKEEASTRIAAATGSEAGVVTTGAAAGIALSVAACVAGEEVERVHRLPEVDGPLGIALPRGHDIDFGAPVVQMVRLGGGEAVLCDSPGDVEGVERLQAVLYVQSHHVQGGGAPIGDWTAAAEAAGAPLIVDAAAEEDLRRYIELGAGLVIYSGGKALAGLTSSGLVAGRRDLVAAVAAQERGIGRAMKVGPEQILSVCIALDAHGDWSRGEAAALEALAAACGECEGATFEVVPDEAGRDIRRLEVRTAMAAAVATMLREGEPPIFVRAHHAGEGRFALDPRNLAMADVPLVAERLREALRAASSSG